MDGPLKILRFGKKEIYLPKFTVALIRTPRLSPYHAKFQVPLEFSKYDLRDYLFHAYNVRAISIRSSVVQQAVRDRPELNRQWFRPQAKKFMTIEMDKPFVWPEDPESWEPWGKEEKEQNEKEAAEHQAGGIEKKKADMEKLREQARRVLGGNVKGNGLVGWEKSRTGVSLGVEEERKYKIRV